MDWDYFRNFINDDIDLELEILSIFLESAPVYIEEIEVSSVADWPAACHKLKGAARAIGAWALAYQTELAELSQTPDQASDARRAIITELKNRYNELRNEAGLKHDIFII